MNHGTIGVGQGQLDVVRRERDELLARARLHVQVLAAVMSNRAKRDAENARLFARDLAYLKEILARLEDLDEPGGRSRPWRRWGSMWARLKLAMRMAGIGHRRVGLNFAGC